MQAVTLENDVHMHANSRPLSFNATHLEIHNSELYSFLLVWAK
jgi:hypothetical protein